MGENVMMRIEQTMMVFEQPNYGEYYIVLAEKTQDALDKLKAYLRIHSLLVEEYAQWKDATLDNLPDRFTLRGKDCDIIVAERS